MLQKLREYWTVPPLGCPVSFLASKDSTFSTSCPQKGAEHRASLVVDFGWHPRKATHLREVWESTGGRERGSKGQVFQLFTPYCCWAHSCPLHLGLAPMFPSLTDVGLVKCCWHCPIIGSPGGSVVKNLPVHACQCRRHGFDPCVGKTPCRRAWQPTPVFLPAESHGQRSLVGYSPRGRKKSRTGLSD